MIPLSDAETPRRHFPVVNYAIIGLNAIAFLYELMLPEARLQSFISAYGAVPLEIIAGRDIPPPGPSPIYLTLFTSMFLHGGWLHFLSNMLYLWVFGDNVEDCMGRWRYVVFYLACGLAAAFAQIMIDPNSVIPSIGASGAISGVLGAYLVLFPHAMVRTLISFGYFVRLVPVPAIVIIGLWALTQFIYGIASLGVDTAQTGGIAYWAHIGGFVAGLGLVFVVCGLGFIRRQRERQRQM